LDEEAGFKAMKQWDHMNYKLDEVLHEMTFVKENFEQAMKLLQDSPIPPGLRKSLRETFKCRICLQAIKPPLVITKCCRVLMGCEECINGWFREDALMKPCPSCRMARGYNETMILRGMDDFLLDLRHCCLHSQLIEAKQTSSSQGD